MSTSAMTVAALIVALLGAQAEQHFIPTSEVVRVASMAAHDEGYDLRARGIYLDELRTKDGREPIKGYSSIALYKNDQIVRSYSIRVATGDVVDATECQILRYPDLLSFKKTVLSTFKTSDVTTDIIASEVGCAQLEAVPKTVPGSQGK